MLSLLMIREENLSLFSKNTVASECSRDALQLYAEHGEVSVLGFQV